MSSGAHTPTYGKIIKRLLNKNSTANIKSKQHYNKNLTTRAY